jgi:DNA-directed RNA polymerase specialized sigma24 family protein
MTRRSLDEDDLPLEVIELAIRGPDQPGARNAFEKLYRHYEPRVQRAVVYAGRKTGYLRGPERLERRDELTQEVWTRFLGKPEILQWYQPRRSAFGGFIWKVAYQQALYCLHRRRWASPHVGYDLFIDESAMDGALTMLQSDLFARFMEMAREQLDELDMMLIMEHHICGETLRALATKHGRGEDALQKRNKKLFGRLERIIDELHQQPSMASAMAILLLFMGVLG